MLINQIISACMAFGVLLGGIDAVLGNRFGFGSRFEQGFRLLGPIALSMAGIICMTPTLSTILEVTLVPMLKLIRMDPGIFGGLLAIDMGGYSLAAELALDAKMRDFSGIILAATFGCTLVFVIPVAETLDLKKAARAAGVKSIAMIPQKKLLPLTGYVHGGCSPVGMSKPFPTYFAEEVILVDTMVCSAGKVGHQVEVKPEDLIAFVGGQVADLVSP